jgi:hypothetical protein
VRGETIQTILSHSLTTIVLNLRVHLNPLMQVNWQNCVEQWWYEETPQSRSFSISWSISFGLQWNLQSSQNVSFWGRWSHHQGLLKYRHLLSLSPPLTWSRGSSISTVSDYGLDYRAIAGRGKRILPLASVFRPTLGPTQPPVGTARPFPGGKARPGRDADY